MKPKSSRSHPTLLAQDYPRFEIVAVNDRSQDRTPAILHEFERANQNLKVIDIADLPPGWLGKAARAGRGVRTIARRLDRVHRCRRSFCARCAAPRRRSAQSGNGTT